MEHIAGAPRARVVGRLARSLQPMRYVAFVRAVMIGREGLHREVILDIFRDAGAVNVMSHLATGNVSFTMKPSNLEALRTNVDGAITSVVGRQIEVFLRSVEHLKAIDADAIYAESPFPDVRDRLVTFFHEPPVFNGFVVPSLVQRERTAVLAIHGSDVFSVTRMWEGQFGSPGGLFERESGQRMTTRAWGTVEKILAKQA